MKAFCLSRRLELRATRGRAEGEFGEEIRLELQGHYGIPLTTRYSGIYYLTRTLLMDIVHAFTPQPLRTFSMIGGFPEALIRQLKTSATEPSEFSGQHLVKQR